MHSRMSRVSINTIAKEAGVSRNTVSLALRGDPRVADATRKSVLAIAEKQDYRPNLLARAMVTGRSSMIGLAIPSLNFSYMPRLVDAIHEVAFQNGYGVLTCSHHNESSRLPAVLTYLHDRRVDGIIAQFPVTPNSKSTTIEHAVPTVMFSFGQKSLPGLSLELLPAAAGELAVQKLYAAGHRKIGYAGESSGFFGEARLAGVSNIAHELGLPSPKVLTCVDSLTGGQQAAAQFLALKQKPTAIVCFTDTVAVGLAQAVQSAGLSVPRDLSIVGVDDLPIAEASFPPLTTLRAPAAEMGQAAMAALLGGGGTTKERRTFSWEWVDRQSIAAPVRLA